MRNTRLLFVHLDKIFEKVTSGELYVDFGGPAGGSVTLTGDEHQEVTRKAFAACRVILVQGQFDFSCKEIMWGSLTLQMDLAHFPDTGIR